MNYRILLLFFLPIIAAFSPYLASQFFDSPQLHGILSADMFLLVLLAMFPHGSILHKMPLVVVIGIWAVISNTMDSYAVAIVYILMVFVIAIIPRNRKCLLPTFSLFALFFFVADAGNFFYSTFVLNYADVWGLAKFYWWGPIAFVVVPLSIVSLQIYFARKILWGRDRLEISHLYGYTIFALAFMLNFGLNELQDRQPLMDFAVKKWFWQICSPGMIGQNTFLQEDIKVAYPSWDKEIAVVSDFTKPTVMVLVESYGVNKSVSYTEALFSPFDTSSNTNFLGLYSRKASHTQGSEWEDFGALGGVVSTVPLPQKFKDNGLQTWFLHGYDGNFYEREKNYLKFGFDSLLFRKDFSNRRLTNCHYGFTGICDSSITAFIDSLLSDSIPKFIYWTTLDAHPPYELSQVSSKTPICKSLQLSEIDCSYLTLHINTMNHLVKLAARHKDYRFIIRGDHRPMGSLEQTDFVQSFYFRWVPLVILN